MKRPIFNRCFMLILIMILLSATSFAEPDTRNQLKQSKREADLKKLQERFQWWPTDAKPGMVQDQERGGFWWWPTQPGEMMPWGNRGYVYVYKIIYDYKEEDKDEEEPPVKEVEAPVQPIVEPVAPPVVKAPELKPSLLIRKIIKNVKIYFDYNKADLREDHHAVLENAVKNLKRNPEASILITGNCDVRGSEEYNLKLGKKRADVVKQFMLEKGIPEDKVLIISRGKLDAVAPVSNLIGMQKDRNAQFMVAEVEEIMIPEFKESEFTDAKPIEDSKYLIEKEVKVETSTKISTREYVIKKDDSLSKIAQKELGGAHRWKFLYELNKDVIKDPNKLKVGQKLLIPVE